MRAGNLVLKEFRALALPWLACLATMIASTVVDRGAYIRIGMLVYFNGVAGLGALSIGHEYLHRTLPGLLSLPIDRRRLLMVKLGVLAVMLAVVSRVAADTVFAGRLPVGDLNSGFVRVAVLLVPPLSALLIAPWLTMACRSPLAGAIFSMSMPGVSLTAGTLVGLFVLGWSGDLDGFRATFFVWSFPAVLAFAAVMTWRTFMRLEAIDGRGGEIRLPAWLTRRERHAAPRHHRPAWWLLVRKELHLYQMVYAIALLELGGWCAASALAGVVPHVTEVFWVLSFFYGVLVAVLVGSHASAEERHLGTRDWQSLFPVSSSAQWIIKVTVAIGLSLTLAIGLPALLAWISRPEVVLGGPAHAAGLGVGLVILLTVAALYVSSVSTTGIRAQLAAWPALFAAGWFVETLSDALGRPTTDALKRFVRLPVPLDSPVNAIDGRLLDGLGLALVAAVLLLVLRFALTNHRLADRARRRVALQVIGIAGALATAVVVLGLA